MAEPTHLFSAGTKAKAAEVNRNFREALNNYRDFTYGETIAVNDALYLAKGGEIVPASSVSHLGTGAQLSRIDSLNDWLAQTYKASAEAIKQITLRLQRGGSPGGNLVVAIREIDAAGKPTGPDLGSVSIPTNDVPTLRTSVVFPSFSPPVNVTSGVNYAIVLRVEGGTLNTWNHINWNKTNADTYADGVPWLSTNGGTSWSSVASDFYFKVDEAEFATPGKCYLTNASYGDSPIHNFVGFAKEAGVLNDVKKVQVGGKIGGFSALTIGSDYYLSDTAGMIDVVAGTNKMPIGLAISATEILIIRGARQKYIDAQPGNLLVASADAPRGNPGGTTPTRTKEIRTYRSGRFRISFEMRTGVGGGEVRGQIYKNFSPYGTQRSTTSTTYVSFTEDLTFSSGDRIQIYAWRVGGDAVSIRNFRIRVLSADKLVVIIN